MDKFYQLFLQKLKFSYDSFDRIVINGYIMNFMHVKGLSFYLKIILNYCFINKSILFSFTDEYKQKIAIYAKGNNLNCEYIDNNIRKDEFVKKYRERFEKKEKFGVYYIFKTKENESTYRVSRPNKKDCDSDNYLSKTRKPYTQYYFYIHDKILGNMSIRVASYLPFKVTAYLNAHSYIERYLKNIKGKKAIYKKRDNAFLNIKDTDLLFEAKENFTPELIKERLDYWLEILSPDLAKLPLSYSYFIDQIEYSRNFIFKGHFFIRELFNRSCELSMQLISTDHIRQIFKTKVKDDKINKKLNRLDDGYYVFKAWFKRSTIKQYRKFSNFLRFELTCNHLPDMKMKKALENLPIFEKEAEKVLDRYSETEASMLNCHADVDYFTKHSKPVMQGNTKIAALHPYQERINRLLEVFLHDNRAIGQWKSMDIRRRIIAEYELEESDYSRNQVIYDIRKLRAHGIIERIGRQNRYRLTSYGIKIALAFTIMRKRIYGPLHYSLFHYQSNNRITTESILERMYRQLDSDINNIQEYIAGKKVA